MKYRINWQSKKTGITEHGEPVFSNREVAQDVAEQLNLQDIDIQLYHWVEAVPDEQTNNSTAENQEKAMISTNPNPPIPDWAQFQVSLSDHPVITDPNGILRYQAKPLAQWLCNQTTHKAIWKAYEQNQFSRDELMQFSRDIGYSLTGFQEIWGEVLNEMENQDSPAESTE
jgi:hypothetical protein